jgi:hypothetical protein
MRSFVRSQHFENTRIAFPLPRSFPNHKKRLNAFLEFDRTVTTQRFRMDRPDKVRVPDTRREWFAGRTQGN